jgi:hypothetical protein
MMITLAQASEILSRTEDEVLYIANSEQRLPVTLVSDQELTYNKDGTISFNDDVEHTAPEWIFELEDVLAFKKEMDEGLVGEVERLLEGK